MLISNATELKRKVLRSHPLYPSKQTFYRRRPSQCHILPIFCLQSCSRYVLTCCCSTLGETYVSYNHDDNKFINRHQISLQDISAIQNKITISFQTDKTNNKIYEACRRKRTMKVKTKFNIYNVEAQTSSTRMQIKRGHRDKHTNTCCNGYKNNG